MGPRKNLAPMVKWFAEEFHKEEVGFVVKANIVNNSSIDRIKLKNAIESILKPFGEERKCKVHLVHGNMSDEEVHSLYVDPKVKAYITATHGEGFGLPIFEAAYSGLPVVAPAWSGHVDFLTPYSVLLPGQVKKVHPSVVWENVILPESEWFTVNYNYVVINIIINITCSITLSNNGGCNDRGRI